MIEVYEDLSTTDLTDEEKKDYISFIQANLDEEYPHLDIQVIDGVSLNKVVNEIGASVAGMWELWEKR